MEHDFISCGGRGSIYKKCSCSDFYATPHVRVRCKQTMRFTYVKKMPFFVYKMSSHPSPDSSLLCCKDGCNSQQWALWTFLPSNTFDQVFNNARYEEMKYFFFQERHIFLEKATSRGAHRISWFQWLEFSRHHTRAKCRSSEVKKSYWKNRFLSIL